VRALFQEHVDVAALVTDARSLADATAMQVISSEPRALWTQPVALLWLVLAVVGAQVIHLVLLALGRSLRLGLRS